VQQPAADSGQQHPDDGNHAGDAGKDVPRAGAESALAPQSAEGAGQTAAAAALQQHDHDHQQADQQQQHLRQLCQKSHGVILA
jgi:hypothetical protein